MTGKKGSLEKMGAKSSIKKDEKNHISTSKREICIVLLRNQREGIELEWNKDLELELNLKRELQTDLSRYQERYWDDQYRYVVLVRRKSKIE